MPHLEISLVHCNIANNDYEQDSRVLLYTFVLSKPFVKLLEISPVNFTTLKTSNQNFKPLKYGLQIKMVSH